MYLEQLEKQETEQIQDLFESSAIQFNKLKHTYFKNFIKNNESYLDFLKIGSRHFGFQFPENIEEIFLKKENSPLFWLLESPLLAACEKSFLENTTSTRQFDRNEIKKSFTKWAIAQDASQKKMHSAVAVKDIKNWFSSVTFIDIIYQALMLIFENSIRNPYKAIEELTRAQSLVDESSLDAGIKKELYYFIQLYKGYALLSVGDTDDAATELSYAMDSKDGSITAKFYFAFLSALQKRDDFTKAQIKGILGYDLERLSYAIDRSSIVMFNFFLANPVFPNIFNHYEFAPYSEFILQDLIESDLDKRKIVSNLLERLNQLKKHEYDEFYTDETKHTIKFLYDVCEQHTHNNSVFLSLAAKNINEKFHFVLDDIKSKIKEKHYENYNHIMEYFDKAISDSENLIDQFKKDVDEIKEALKEKLNTQVQQIEEYVKNELWAVEERKKNIAFQSSFDPAVSFRNSMSYNVMASIIVFIIGGIAGYFNNSNYFESDFYLMLGKIVLTGVKWSSLTFVIGFFISVFISGLAVLDRSNEKQKLEKRTVELQKQKEISIEIIKKEAEQKQKALSEGYLERIEAHKKKIEDTKKEKERQEPILIAEAEGQLTPFTEKLSPLYLP